MANNHVYKTIEITGTSEKGTDEAVQNALHAAGETVRNMRWFEVTDIRGDVSEEHVAHWQVTVKIGFTLERQA